MDKTRVAGVSQPDIKMTKRGLSQKDVRALYRYLSSVKGWDAVDYDWGISQKESVLKAQRQLIKYGLNAEVTYGGTQRSTWCTLSVSLVRFEPEEGVLLSNILALGPVCIFVQGLAKRRAAKAAKAYFIERFGKQGIVTMRRIPDSGWDITIRPRHTAAKS